MVVKSEELYEQQRLTLDKNLRKIESGLEKIRGQLNVRKYKNPAYVAERVKKVLDSHCAGKLFRVVLDGEEGALTLHWDYEPGLIEQQERLLGKYILVTSLDRETHDADRVLELYKSRHRVEDRIRAMKGTLKIRPVFLQSEERIRSLVLVNIIALIVYSLIEWVCRLKRVRQVGQTGAVHVSHASYRHPDGKRPCNPADRQHQSVHARYPDCLESQTAGAK